VHVGSLFPTESIDFNAISSQLMVLKEVPSHTKVSCMS
jgi:hypothetical protein